MSNPVRRTVSFDSFADVLADIEQLASGETSTSGSHSFAAIVEHLAKTNDMVTGKTKAPTLPWYMRMMMPFMRKRILNSPVQPGFKLPQTMQDHFWEPKEWELAEAIEHFRESVAYYEEHGPLPVHPVFGPATSDEVRSLTLKHAAMHLSFVLSKADAA